MSKPKYIIINWAGNECFDGRTFKSFELAWGYIYNKFEHIEDEDAFDEEMSEYEVVEAG